MVMAGTYFYIHFNLSVSPKAMSLRSGLCFFLCSWIFSGCDSAESGPPEVEGRYTALFAYVVDEEMFDEPWSMTVQEDEAGELTGRGKLGLDSVTVSGMHDHPAVSIEFSNLNGSFGGSFQGSLSNDGVMLQGVYNLSFFFVNAPVSFQRE